MPRPGEQLLRLAAVEVPAHLLVRPARALDDRDFHAAARKLERKCRARYSSADRDRIEMQHATERVM
jgi:hypothetical protein